MQKGGRRREEEGGSSGKRRKGDFMAIADHCIGMKTQESRRIRETRNANVIIMLERYVKIKERNVIIILKKCIGIQEREMQMY